VLTIIPTPIGNLKDITLRAIEVLNNCDIVFCEDTRRTLQLLSAHNIRKKVLRYNDHIEKNIYQCIALLIEGKNICLLTDSGMPTISDPGWKLVNKARENNIKVEVLPGPSALTTAITGSGLPADSFIFLGFMPRSLGKIIKILNQAFTLKKPIILYESPYRIKKLIEILKNNFSNTQIIIARELTKVFEEWIFGNINEVYDKLKGREIKGEITIILYSKDYIVEKKGQKIKNILFVCTGNSCRSVMAHYYAKKIAKEKNLDYNFSSAGVYVEKNFEVPDMVKKILKKENIDIQHKPTQFNYEIAENSDLILTMTEHQKELINGYIPDFKEKIFTLMEYINLGNIDISDPFGKNDLEYEMTFKTIKNAVNIVFEKLIQENE